MQCAQCGTELQPNAAFCGNCGAQILQPAQQIPGTAQPQVAAPAPAAPAATPVAIAPQPAPFAVGAAPAPNVANTTYAVPKTENSGLSIASLILGIIGLLSSLIWFIAIPFGLMALIFGLIGRGKGGKGMATTGIITGSLAIVATIIITALAANYLAKHPEARSSSSSYFHPVIEALN
jgi:hypothetical protein